MAILASSILFCGGRFAYGWTLRLGWLGKSYWLLLYMKDMIQMSNMEKKGVIWPQQGIGNVGLDLV